MPSLFPVQDALVRGELSPRLHARASIDLYRAGLSRCENFLTLPHGGIRKRGGTYYVDEVIDSARAHRVIPFIFSDDQAYCLVFGHLKLRIYAYGARVGSVELTTPWASTELAALMFVGSKDQMWITHPDHPTQVLTRTAHTSWALADFDPSDGPFDAVNTNETHQMYVSAISGAGITITSDFAIFTAADVGRLVRIDMESFRTIPPWEPDQRVYNVASSPSVEVPRVRYNGNVYDLSLTPTVSSYFTGATPPTHTKGTEYDGTDTSSSHGAGTRQGVQWTYRHSGFGVARITAFTNSTHVTATVLSRFPDELVGSGNKSFVWRFGALDSGGYAGAVTLFEERLALGVGTSVYASGSFKFDSFKPGPEANDALQFLVVGDDIAWLKDVEGVLALGTIGGVQALSGSGLDVALSPSSFKKRKSPTYTCAPLMPAEVDSGLIYVTKSRKSLAEMTLSNIGRFTTQDIGQVSEHIPKKGIIELAFQQYPDPYLWFPVQTGELGALTYQPSQDVRGMHRHLLGGAFGATAHGIVEGACVTPGQTGQDDLWLIVKRIIGGVTKRYIEIMTAPFEYGALVDAFQVDCGLTYSGAAVNSVTGADHLAGQTVAVLADGVVYSGLAVGSVVPNVGKVTLPGGATAAKWQLGLPMPAYADTLELDVGGRDGSLRGRRKRVSHVYLSVMETDRTGLEISSYIQGKWEPANIPTNTPANNTVPSLFTGNIGPIKVDDSWMGKGKISIRHTTPTPATILAIIPQFDSEI